MKQSARARQPLCQLGFTLLEVLATMAVLSIFVLLLATITDSSLKLWRNTQSSIAMFDAARAAYDTMARRLSQATVNTYLDYYDSGWQRRSPTNAASFTPAKYGRTSDLHFLTGDAASLLGISDGTVQGHGVFFQAPLGYTNNDPTYADLPNLLNAMGYYVQFGTDKDLRPDFLDSQPERHRYRLMENILPSQKFTFFPKFTDTDASNDKGWLTVPDGLAGADSDKHALADNIIALIIRPEVTDQDATLLNLGAPYDLTEDYNYDSRHTSGANRSDATRALQFAQLPPMLRVVMIAVDEKNAKRLTTGTTPPAAFQIPADAFKDPAEFDTDLADLSKALVDAGVQFRVFNQVIALRGAKFSAQKEN